MGKKKSGFLKEFKEFAMKGNMLDLAVGVIVGGAFKTVVDALTNSVIMPVVSMFLGGLSFEEWKIRLPQFFGEKLDAINILPAAVCGIQPDDKRIQRIGSVISPCLGKFLR